MLRLDRTSAPAALPRPQGCEPEARLLLAKRCIEAQRLPEALRASLTLQLCQAGNDASRSAWAAMVSVSFLQALHYFEEMAVILTHTCNVAELQQLLQCFRGEVGCAVQCLRTATHRACTTQAVDTAKSASPEALREFAALYQLFGISRPRTLALPQHTPWLLRLHAALGADAAWVIPSLRAFLSSPLGQHYLRVVRPAVSQWSTRFVHVRRLDAMLRQRLQDGLEDDVAI